jgi:hypothetical protein
MATIRTGAALAALLAILATTLALPRAQAQMTACNWYADTAVKQQQQNERWKCGLKGAEWSSSRQAHLAWCTTQVPDKWKAVAQQREQQLAACKR